MRIKLSNAFFKPEIHKIVIVLIFCVEKPSRVSRIGFVESDEVVQVNCKFVTCDSSIASECYLAEGIFRPRKKAEQALVRALVKFHNRRVERLKNKYRKLEQAQSRRSYQETNQSSRKTQSRTRNKKMEEIEIQTEILKNENELAEMLKPRLETLLEQMKAQAKNKKIESYLVVLSDPLEIRDEGKRNTTENKVVQSRRRYERRKIKAKNCFQITSSQASNI